MSELTQNSILRISDEQTLRLIDMYEKERCLWDTTHLEYRHRGKRSRAAERIARKLAIKHFEARHVLIKFKNLRNSYCQELKKIAQSHKQAKTDSEVYKPRVFWYLKMDSFLRPHLQPTPGNAYFSYLNQQNAESNKKSVVVKMEQCSDEGDPESGTDREPGPLEKTPLSSEDEAPAPLLKRRRKMMTCPRAMPLRYNMHTCIEQSQSAVILRSIARYLQTLSSRRDDAFDTFGTYVAAMLRGLPRGRALALQPRIVELLSTAAAVGDVTGPSDVTQCRVSQSDGIVVVE